MTEFITTDMPEIRYQNINEVYPKVFQLNLPLPLDVKDVNLYLIAGEIPTLIEVGIQTPLFLAGIKALMARAGVRQIQRILLTHWHIDHAGIAAVLAKDGAEIFTNEIDYGEWLTFARPDSFALLHNWMVSDWGVPKEELRLMYQNHCFYQTLYTLPAKVTLLKPGDFVQAGDYRAQIISTPGHTAGHVSYWLEDEGVLFSGDALLPDQLPYPETWLEGTSRVSGLPFYIQSVKKIAQLQGERYFPAHGPTPGSDPTARCQVVLDKIHSQVKRHVPAETVYAGTAQLREKFGSDLLIYHLHHVFGWEAVRQQLS